VAAVLLQLEIAAWKRKEATETVGTVFAASFTCFYEIAEGGLEQAQNTTVKTAFPNKGAAKSGAVDESLVELILLWPGLPENVKEAILCLVRFADKKRQANKEDSLPTVHSE